MSLDVTSPPLFDLLESKLGWIDARQRVLAQNVANTDTPDYQAKDLSPFEASLSQFNIEPVLTSPLHLAGLSSGISPHRTARSERAPDGNAVGLENQLTKIADDESAQALTGNLWKTYMGMFMTALGHG
jgi:flagellar basal-body rod protein FlgB